MITTIDYILKDKPARDLSPDVNINLWISKFDVLQTHYYDRKLIVSCRIVLLNMEELKECEELPDKSYGVLILRLL